MKEKRQSAICELIRKYNIETQEELARLLSKQGFAVTQTTVSRDIKELKLIKIQSDTGLSYKYTLPTALNSDEKKHDDVFEKQLVSVCVSGALLVVKTAAGAAALVGRAVDDMKKSEILGCVSGFDTVFIATENDAAAAALHSELKVFEKTT